MVLNAPTISTMLFGAIRKMWKGHYDAITTSEAICWHNTLSADSADPEGFDLDLQQLYLRPARYTRLVRQYLDPSNVHRFLQTAKDIALGNTKEGAVCSLQTRPIRGTTTHRFGNCIFGFCYSGLRPERTNRRPSAQEFGHPPTFTMLSRTAYLSYIGCLDLALAYALIREIAARTETDPKEFRLVWLSTSLQFHTLKSLPLLLSTPLLSAPSPRNELQTKIMQWHHKFQTPGGINGESRFGPVRRVQNVYKRHAEGRLYPSVLVNTLGLPF